MTVADLDPVDAAWHEWRRHGIGGSDISALVGLAPASWGRGPFGLWAEKVGLTDNRVTGNELMDFGKRAESLILDWFAETTGLDPTDRQRACEHPDHPWQRCTVDAIVYPAGEPEPVEVKTTPDAPADWEAEIPVYYQAQAQWQMHVVGAARCHFAVLHISTGRRTLARYVLERNDDDITRLVDAATRFWNDHVLTGIPPAATGPDRRAIGDVYDKPTDDAVVLADLADQVDELRDTKAAIRSLEQYAEQLAAEITAALGNATVGTDNTGRIIATWKPQEQSRIDIDKLKSEWPDAAASCTTRRTHRVLRTPKPKPSSST